jgi:hypothetical protein
MYKPLNRFTNRQLVTNIRADPAVQRFDPRCSRPLNAHKHRKIPASN